MKKLLLLSLLTIIGLQTANAQCSANFTSNINGLNVTFTNTSSGFGNQSGWSWDFGDATTSTALNPPMHTYPSAGTYTVCLGGIDLISTCFDSTCHNITLVSSNVTEYTLNTSSVAVYPSPATEFTTLSFQILNKANVTIELFDIAGKMVKTLGSSNMNAGMYTISINISDMTAGVYFVKLNVDGQLITKKLTKL